MRSKEYLCIFADQRLDQFSRSHSLPYPLGYFKREKNPILEVLADQLRHDQEWERIDYTGSHLLINILNALDEKQLAWPNHFIPLTCEEWRIKISNHPKFYWHSAKNGEEMRMHEMLLLNLAANLLKRTIVLIPIHNEDSKHTIKPLVPIEDANLLYIGYCNKLFQRNIFISVLPKL